MTDVNKMLQSNGINNTSTTRSQQKTTNNSCAPPLSPESANVVPQQPRFNENGFQTSSTNSAKISNMEKLSQQLMIRRHSALNDITKQNKVKLSNQQLQAHHHSHHHHHHHHHHCAIHNKTRHQSLPQSPQQQQSSIPQQMNYLLLDTSLLIKHNSTKMVFPISLAYSRSPFCWQSLGFNRIFALKYRVLSLK